MISYRQAPEPLPVSGKGTLPVDTTYQDYKTTIGLFNQDGKFKLAKAPLHETWAELQEKLVGKGLVRNIGLDNYNTQVITDLLSNARIKSTALEIEIHPYFQQKRLIKWVFEAVPPHLEPIEKLLSHPVVKKIEEKYNINVGQVALGWAVQKEYLVIPKSVNEDRMRFNLAAFDISFDEEDGEELDALDQKARFIDFYVENYIFD